VKDPADYGKLGNEVEVLVIGIEAEKISLSMKRLVEDPWLEATKQFKIGDIIEGEINRLTPFGAFLKIGADINGLIHLSEISVEALKDPSEVLKIGDKVKAKIIAIEPTEHRIGLSIKAMTEEPKKKIKKSEEAKTEETAETAKEEVKAAKEEVKAPKKPKKKVVVVEEKGKAPAKKTVAKKKEAKS
jgi:small subunit ribosomal protein S1